MIRFVTVGPGRAEVDRLISGGFEESRLLGELSSLRSRFDHRQAAAIVDQALLRRRASAKFNDADEMVFDREGLEQATPEIVAVHRSSRIAELDPDLIVELGTGIGGDARALTRVAPVIGIDLDPHRLAMARHNVAVAGGTHPFHPVCADVMAIDPLPADVGVADPARRGRGRRARQGSGYLPPLGPLIDRWRPALDAMAVKVAPGIDDADIPSGASVEWVSLDGGLREAVLWLGDLADGASRRATVLPAGATITGPEPEIAVTPVGAWLHEPDDAVVRASLVRALAAEIGATMIDPRIAYLTSPHAADHPMVTDIAVDEVMPFNLKRLRDRLRRLEVGSVTIRKRGSPLTPEELRPRLRLDGDRHATIVLTRTPEGPIALIGP